MLSASRYNDLLEEAHLKVRSATKRMLVVFLPGKVIPLLSYACFLVLFFFPGASLL